MKLGAYSDEELANLVIYNLMKYQETNDIEFEKKLSRVINEIERRSSQ